MNKQEYLRRIQTQPRSDSVRLEYSQWLRTGGDPFGEFIQTQCDIARLNSEDPYAEESTYEMKIIEEKLLDEHRHEWLGFLKPLGLELDEEHFGFVRGMLEEVYCSVDYFLKHGSKLIRPELPLLTRLKLFSDDDAPVRGLGAAPFLGHFSSLDLRDCKIDDLTVEELCRSPHSLGIRQLHLGPSDSVAVEKQWFRDQGWMLSDRTAKAIAQSDFFMALERLDIPFTDIGDEGFIAIAESKKLDHLNFLDVSAGNITHRGLRHFFSSGLSKRLDIIGFERNNLSDFDSDARPSEFAHSLRVANLNGSSLGDSEIASISASFSPNILYLAENGISSKGVKTLVATKLSDNLTCLVLSRNDLGPNGLLDLAKSNAIKYIRHLILNRCNLGDEAIVTFAKEIGLNNIKNLYISNNHIGDPGAIAIARTPFLSGLEELGLHNNAITTAGAKAILESPYLAGVRRITITGHNVDPAILNKFRERYGE